MSHKHHHDKDHGSGRHRKNRGDEEKTRDNQNEFMTKEDLARILAIKPFLSQKGQMLVEIAEEIQHTEGRLDQNILSKLLGKLNMGPSNNMNAPSSLAGLTGLGEKIDPAALMPLLKTLASKKGGSPESSISGPEEATKNGSSDGVMD